VVVVSGSERYGWTATGTWFLFIQKANKNTPSSSARARFCLSWHCLVSIFSIPMTFEKVAVNGSGSDFGISCIEISGSTGR